MTASTERASPLLLRRAGARLAGGVFVVFAVYTSTFFALRLLPGDPAEAALGGAGSRSTAEQLAAARVRFGLDRPLLAQYVDALASAAHGDLGTSLALRTSVSGLVGAYIGQTLLLAATALIVAWLIAVLVSLWSTGESRIGAAVGSGLEIVALAIPNFWLGGVLILVFAVQLGWLPAVSVPGPLGLVLPVLSLAIPLAGFLGQVMRQSLADALEAPFVLSARARGEGERDVRLRHALRHAVLPAISLSGWAFGALIGGAVVVETLFSRPGLGRTLLQALLVKDTPVVLGVVAVISVVYVLVNLATEIADRVADPRQVAT